MSTNHAQDRKKDALRKIIGNIFFKRTLITILLILLQFMLMLAMLFAISVRSPHIAGFSYIVSILCCIYIININIKEEFKIAWMLPILMFPLFGVFMYVFVLVNPGTRSVKKIMKKKSRNLIPLISKNKERNDYIAQDDEKVGSLIRYLYYKSGHPTYTNTSVKYFALGEDFFVDLLEQLGKAEKFIFMEFFIINEGVMWNPILELLKQKVKEGVEVYLLFDGTNAVTTVPYHYDEQLCGFGIKAKMFAPITPFISTHQNNRDHRKIVVIDGKIGYTGGINLADEYINAYEKHGHWKDIGVRIEGPAVQSFGAMFLYMWNLSESIDIPYDKYLDTPIALTAGEGYVTPYSDDAMNSEDVAENVYLDILNRANDYVYIMSPYLIVDSAMIWALSFAAKRGVDVRIMLPHIPDKKIPFAIARTYYKILLNAGVKIYEYTPGFVHAKLFVSDDVKACVGSVNLDYRSLYHNFECGVFIYDNPEILVMKEDFLSTQEQCIEVDLNYYHSINIFERLVGHICRIFAPLL